MGEWKIDESSVRCDWVTIDCTRNHLCHILVVKEERICKRCGRGIEWRKKWEKVWDSIQYCSDACRRQRVNAVDRKLEECIVRLLSQCASHATICPSEAAREVFPLAWREQMEEARMAARRLVAEGIIEITQGGRVVDPSHVKGPIRLRKSKNFPPSC